MLVTDFQQHKELFNVERIWLKSYPANVPNVIEPNKYQSLNEIFEKSCQQYATLPAYYNLGVTLTYNELYLHARAFASYLQNVLHLKKGDRLAVMLPNTLQYPIAIFGALMAGVIVVNVNPLYTAPELIYQVNNAGAETVIVLSNFAHTVEIALPKTNIKNVIIAHVGDFFSWPKSFLTEFVLKYVNKKIPSWNISKAIMFKDVINQGKKTTFQPVEVHHQDVAFLQYTGGTTGISKGAMLTHRNLIANIMQVDAWFHSFFEKGKEVLLTALPLYHIFSLLANGLYVMSIGGLSVLITNPRDIHHTISEMRKFKLTVVTGVNTLFNALMNNEKFNKIDFSALKTSIGGGAAIHKAVADRWQQLTGKILLEAYGLTEASPCVTINPYTLNAFNGTVGLPVSSTDVVILNDEGHQVSLGQSGELAVKGPQVMLGYWNNPGETEKVFTPDGWLLTGDIASMNEQGFVRILERKKDMILVSGFNVYPNEIEDVLSSIPGVAEAAVIGIPDENTGEAIKAFIVSKDPSLTAEKILEYCRQNLTGYKRPKYIEFRKELPKSNIGKILRRALRDEVSDQK